MKTASAKKVTSVPANLSAVQEATRFESRDTLNGITPTGRFCIEKGLTIGTHDDYRVTISSEDINRAGTKADGALFVSKDDEHVPYQRAFRNSDVTKDLVKCFIAYQNDIDAGVPLTEAEDNLPRGIILLSTIYKKAISNTPFMVVVDAGQRTRAQRIASETIGKPILVRYKAKIFETLSMDELAQEFIWYNVSNHMFQANLIQAAIWANLLTSIQLKFNSAQNRGLFGDFEICYDIEEAKRKNKIYLFSDLIKSMTYGMLGTTSTSILLSRANEFSQEAVDNFATSLRIFREVVGVYSPKEKSRLDYFHKTTFQCVLARVAVNMPFTKKSLTEDQFRNWLTIMTHDKGHGYQHFKYLNGTNSSGGSGREVVSKSLMKKKDLENSVVNSFGIIHTIVDTGKRKTTRKRYLPTGYCKDNWPEMFDRANA